MTKPNKNEANTLAEGLRFHEAGQHAKAETLYREVLATSPDNARALRLLATLKFQQNETAEGMILMQRSLAIDPNQPEAYLNLGVACYDVARHEEGLAWLDSALALRPAYAEAYHVKGMHLASLGRALEAIAAFDACLNLEPTHPRALNDKGIALARLGQYEAAISAYCTLIVAHPKYAKGYLNLGSSLQELKRYAEALTNYQQAFALQPDLPYLLGSIVYNKMMLCDWRALDQFITVLGQAVAHGLPAATPFTLIAAPLSPALKRKTAELCVAHSYPPRPALWSGENYAHSRIRLGYFSSDFHDHATAHLMVELFEKHDRNTFEVTAFSFGPAQNDAMRARLMSAFETFHDVTHRSDAEIAELARRLEIDIAVDLKGFTQNSRPSIFAHRFAPVQLSFLGYPGTMGAPYMDYLIADETVIPDDHAAFYTEKIIRMPGCYQANARSRIHVGHTVSRQALGLPAEGFVFCCFNNHYKITPEIFSIWMRLLAATSGSVLWLLEGNPQALANLRAQAHARGIDPARLVFAPHVPQSDHVARQAAADLFLDTLPCNAHTAASDALAAGLPLVTCLGEEFAGRVAASVLQAVGMTELVSRTLAEYEQKAIELATQPEKLAALKERLRSNIAASALFDSDAYTRHFEQLLLTLQPR